MTATVHQLRPRTAPEPIDADEVDSTILALALAASRNGCDVMTHARVHKGIYAVAMALTGDDEAVHLYRLYSAVEAELSKES